MELNLTHRRMADALRERYTEPEVLTAMSGAITLTGQSRAYLLLLANCFNTIREDNEPPVQLCHRGWLTKIRFSPESGFAPTHYALTESGLRAAEAVWELIAANEPPAKLPNNELVDWTRELETYLSGETETC